MSDQQGDAWLADPTGRHQLRYFAGGQWTDNVSDAGNTAIDPYQASAGVEQVPATTPDAGGSVQAPVSAPMAAAGPAVVAPGDSPAAPGVQPPQYGAPAPGVQPGPYGTPAYGAPPMGGTAGHAASERSRPVIGFSICVLAVLLTIVGAVLPWVTVTGFVEVSKAGLEGDGVITLVVGLVAGLLAVLMLALKSRGFAIGVLVGALINVGISILDLSDVSSKVGTLNSPGLDLQAGAGIGLWITLVASLLLLVGGVVGIIRK